MNIPVLAAYLFGLILLYIAARLLLAPARVVLRLVINGTVGFALLWLLNLVGGIVGLHIGLNPITALVTGFLGIPGIIMLLLLQYVVIP